MAVLMFWNLRGRQNAVALRDLCRTYDVDVLLLAEATAPSIEFMTTQWSAWNTAATMGIAAPGKPDQGFHTLPAPMRFPRLRR